MLLNNFGAKVRLGFFNISEIHPNVYKKFKISTNPTKIKNMK